MPGVERAYGWQDTGHSFQVPGSLDRVPDFDQRTGEHLWVILSMYRWGGPQVENPTLDPENLLLIAAPGCYYCEQPWTQRLATRRCKGEAPDSF